MIDKGHEAIALADLTIGDAPPQSLEIDLKKNHREEIKFKISQIWENQTQWQLAVFADLSVVTISSNKILNNSPLKYY